MIVVAVLFPTILSACLNKGQPSAPACPTPSIDVSAWRLKTFPQAAATFRLPPTVRGRSNQELMESSSDLEGDDSQLLMDGRSLISNPSIEPVSACWSSSRPTGTAAMVDACCVAEGDSS